MYKPVADGNNHHSKCYTTAQCFLIGESMKLNLFIFAVIFVKVSCVSYYVSY